MNYVISSENEPKISGEMNVFPTDNIMVNRTIFIKLFQM